MDLKDFVTRYHPGILRKFEEEKEKQQPPKSAPPYLPSQFNFPPNSPTFSTWKTFPPKESTPSPALSEDLLSEASAYMSSPVKMIPETQPQSPLQYLSQSRSQSPTMAEVVEMETELQNRILPTHTFCHETQLEIPETQLEIPETQLSQSPSKSFTREQLGLSEEDFMQLGNRL